MKRKREYDHEWEQVPVEEYCSLAINLGDKVVFVDGIKGNKHAKKEERRQIAMYHKDGTPMSVCYQYVMWTFGISEAQRGRIHSLYSDIEIWKDSDGILHFFNVDRRKRIRSLKPLQFDELGPIAQSLVDDQTPKVILKQGVFIATGQPNDLDMNQSFYAFPECEKYSFAQAYTWKGSTLYVFKTTRDVILFGFTGQGYVNDLRTLNPCFKTIDDANLLRHQEKLEQSSRKWGESAYELARSHKNLYAAAYDKPDIAVPKLILPAIVDRFKVDGFTNGSELILYNGSDYLTSQLSRSDRRRFSELTGLRLNASSQVNVS